MAIPTDEASVRAMAALEEGVSVTAGIPDPSLFYQQVERRRTERRDHTALDASVLGRFLNVARRERLLTLEQLAAQVDVAPLELLLAEEGHAVPGPGTISRLARALEVPPGKLLQLAGYANNHDTGVVAAAYEFAARATSKPLEPQEREALHDFLKVLTEK